MSEIWSNFIQGTMTLYLSRKLRFDDIFFNQYAKIFNLDNWAKIKILEIGCGPGALAEALHRWYPNAEITAIDRDTNFISFAKENISGVNFIEGDITRLPFSDNNFDVVISNTVQEHIDPTVFWNEQKRVLKSEGICFCLSSRRGINCNAVCLEMTDVEKEFWKNVPDYKDELEKYSVGKYHMSESEIPLSMEENGFTNVSTGYVVIDLTPDDSKYSSEFAEEMIEAMRQNDIEALSKYESLDTKEILEIINDKYNKRIQQYRNGDKQWDTLVSIIMVVRGVVDKK